MRTPFQADAEELDEMPSLAQRTRERAADIADTVVITVKPRASREDDAAATLPSVIAHEAW
jgi:hypothetical protein